MYIDVYVYTHNYTYIYIYIYIYVYCTYIYLFILHMYMDRYALLTMVVLMADLVFSFPFIDDVYRTHGRMKPGCSRWCRDLIWCHQTWLENPRSEWRLILLGKSLISMVHFPGRHVWLPEGKLFLWLIHLYLYIIICWTWILLTFQ